MKKIFAILGTAVLAAAVLTGCSNAAGGSKNTPTASTNNGTNPGGNNNGTNPGGNNNGTNPGGNNNSTNPGGNNNGANLTQEQQELGTKFNAVLEANNDALQKLSLATQKAANGGLQQEDINSAKTAVSAIKPKVKDLKTKAKEYLNKKGKTTEAAKVETVCTTYTNALDQVVPLLTEAAGDPSNKKAQLSQATMNFYTAYQQFGQEAQTLQALFQ